MGGRKQGAMVVHGMAGASDVEGVHVNEENNLSQ